MFSPFEAMVKTADDFEIIIATYNREKKVVELINQIFSCDIVPARIIVVDSSDYASETLAALPHVTYIRSSHKNQPYQRYVGWRVSKRKYLVFFDDDMEIVNSQYLEVFQAVYEDPAVVACMGRLKDKHRDTMLANAPRSALSKLYKKPNRLVRLMRAVSGYPVLAPGKFSWCGVRGPLIEAPINLQWLSGGAFSAKRSLLFRNVNLQLFDLFEQRLGMGEDAILGHALSILGTVRFIPDLEFIHNDQKDSSYTVDYQSYARRVAFSRLYLALEYGRLNKKSRFAGYFIYHWYMVFRLLGQIVSNTKRSTPNGKKMLQGTLHGWIQSFGFRYNSRLGRNAYWEKEVSRNLRSVDI